MITRSCELCVKMENIMIIFWVQVAFTTWKVTSDVWLTVHTSLLIPHPPSLSNQYCCIPSNSGKKSKTRENDVVRIILCPNYLPSSCQTFSLNCSEVFKQDVSAK